MSSNREPTFIGGRKLERGGGVPKFKRVDKSNFDMKCTYTNKVKRIVERISVEWLVSEASRSTLMTFKKVPEKKNQVQIRRERMRWWRLKMTRLLRRATLWVTYVHHLLAMRYLRHWLILELFEISGGAYTFLDAFRLYSAGPCYVPKKLVHHCESAFTW